MFIIVCFVNEIDVSQFQCLLEVWLRFHFYKNPLLMKSITYTSATNLVQKFVCFSNSTSAVCKCTKGCSWHRVNASRQHHTADIKIPVKYTMYARFVAYSRLIFSAVYPSR